MSKLISNTGLNLLKSIPVINTIHTLSAVKLCAHTEYGPVDNVGVRKANFYGVMAVLDAAN